jgi:hypothetical protein
MPVGVVVDTVTTPAGSGDDTTASASFFLSGLTERGSTTEAVLVRSMGEAVSLLGARVTYGSVYDQLETFFNEGGGRAYVARVVGPAATVGALTLNDRAGVPVATLRIDAKDPGPWSSRVTVQVADGVVADTFTITIRFDGEVVETFNNLPSPAAAVTAMAGSGFVRAVDLGSATAPPANNPAVTGPTALSAGTDDRAAVTAADYVTALGRLTPDLGAGAVAIPGLPHTATATGLAAHASTHRRIALLAPDAGTGVAAASTAARGLRGITGAEHVGFFYPWVQVPDGAGNARTISPEGFVAGVRARNISLGRLGGAPAGEAGLSRHVIGVERTLTRDEVNTLADDAVNPIRSGGTGVRLYGWRSLSTDEANYRFLNAREVMNVVAVRGEGELERFVFRLIDGRGHLFTEVEAALVSIVDPLRAAGAVYERIGADGNAVDLGYTVDVGPSVNTAESVARGEVRAVLTVRVSPVGELIRLTITKVALRAEL